MARFIMSRLLSSELLQDWQANQTTSFKSRFILVLFRTVQLLDRLPASFRWVKKIYYLMYQLIVNWLLGVEIPVEAQIGDNLRLLHPIAIVLNRDVVIGSHCTLRHATTIGNKQRLDGSLTASPQIGHRVDIGANVVILGPISVGDNAIIGAGSVVVKDVPAGAIVAGNPAKILRFTEPIDREPTARHSAEIDQVDQNADSALPVSMPLSGELMCQKFP